MLASSYSSTTAATALPVALLLILQASHAAAQTSNSGAYTVHSSVVFTRTGEHTPYLNLDGSSVRTLTSLGAQELFLAGAQMRGRYLSSGSTKISGLSSPIDNSVMTILVTDKEYTIGSAQAFLQGLYPPTNFANTDDPSSILANDTFVQSPLGGYQYPRIRTLSDLDPNSIYIAGDSSCSSVEIGTQNYFLSKDFRNTRNATEKLYETVGAAMLTGVMTEIQWDYANAYLIYDYLSYQYTHNSLIQELFSTNQTYRNALLQMRSLASRQQWAYYGDGEGSSSNSRIAGRTLVSRVLNSLQTNIATTGSDDKLTLIFGDHVPFISFLALSHAYKLNPSFYGLPDWGSSMIFELFSYGTNSTFPSSTKDLWVRFSFRNGTSAIAGTPEFQAYPLFDRGPSETDMPWPVFESQMRGLELDIAGWCGACGENSALFCGPFMDADNDDSSKTCSSSGKGSSGPITPPVAGVIGAVVTLATTGLVAVLLALLCGVRLHRHSGRRKSELGGFKGNAKLASDADLVIPKGGPASVSVRPTIGVEDIGPIRGHERVGSWELKEKEAGDLGLSQAFGLHRPLAEPEDDEIAVNPFSEPVKPNDRV